MTDLEPCICLALNPINRYLELVKYIKDQIVQLRFGTKYNFFFQFKVRKYGQAKCLLAIIISVHNSGKNEWNFLDNCMHALKNHISISQDPNLAQPMRFINFETSKFKLLNSPISLKFPKVHFTIQFFTILPIFYRYII